MRTGSQGEQVLGRLDALTSWPYRPQLLVAVGAAWFFAFFDVVNIGYALPVISEQFGVSSSQAAIAVTLGLVGYVVGSLLDGVIADRKGRTFALTLSVIAFSAGSVVAALSQDLTWLCIGRFIAGMGIGAEISAATAYIGEISPSRLRGRAGGLAAAWGYVGFAVVPFVSMALVPAFSWGWRVLFLIGAAGGLVVLPMRLHLPKSPRWLVAVGRVDDADAIVTAAEERARVKPSRLRVTQVPIDRPPVKRGRHDFVVFALLFVGVWFAYYIGNYGWLTLAPTLLTDQGFSLSTSIAFLSVTGIGFVVGAFTAFGVAERIERKISIIAALVVWAAALTIIGLAPSGGVIMAFGFIASATIGFAVPIMYVYTGEHFHSSNRARGVSIADGTGHIGGAIAPYVVLPAAGLSFAWGMGIMALTGVIAAVLVMFGRRLNGAPAD